MSRFIQEGKAFTPTPKPAKATKPRELPKTGSYTSENLTGIKKIISPNSGRF